jgi:hypothetical protein
MNIVNRVISTAFDLKGHQLVRHRIPIIQLWLSFLSVTETARSKARTAFARSIAGSVGSSPAQGMIFGVCMRLFCV